MHDEVDQDDRIQLPPGWGPVLFLALVVILSDLALGLRVRSMLVNRTVATSSAGAGEGLAGGPGSLPNVPLAGQGAPATGGLHGPDLGQREAVSAYTVDDSVFTQELDDYVREVAESAGMAPEAVPTARQVYEQMERSGLLPANGDLDIQTVLGGHVREMAKHVAGGGGAMAAPGAMGAPGGPDAPPPGGPAGPK